MAPRRSSHRNRNRDQGDSLLDAPVAEALDLHGYRADEVRKLLQVFLTNWRSRGSGLVVHVITGRGRNSPNGPVLGSKVASLLRGELNPLVAEWAPDYNEGGFMVRLR
jgi:DNA-nicking Smr family endonuclease